MSLRELKRAARNDLKGKWHIGIIVTIVAFIIGVYWAAANDKPSG